MDATHEKTSEVSGEIMERKFLEEMGLPKEQIDKILDANSRDIGKAKGDLDAITTERDNLKSQLTTVNESLKKFEGVDVKELQSKIETLQGELRTKDENYQKERAARAFNDDLSAAITAAKGKSVKAISAMLDLDNLRSSNNRQADITGALEKLKESDPYLFGDGSSGKVTSVSTGGAHDDEGGGESPNAAMNNAIRSALRGSN